MGDLVVFLILVSKWAGGRVAGDRYGPGLWLDMIWSDAGSVGARRAECELAAQTPDMCEI